MRHTDTDRFFAGLGGCGKGDIVAYELEATAPNGTQGVDILVCKGLLKGATLRQG